VGGSSFAELYCIIIQINAGSPYIRNSLIHTVNLVIVVVAKIYCHRSGLSFFCV